MSESKVDPDEPLIRDDFPRAAILFGPPGTSKTSIVSAIAGSIGWAYVELHPSHFVAQGLPNVQQTADSIFGKLMQLDHAVVLFDEIDELVRERDMESDQFGRFLTTSMLPRLAELWRARKIMYFVATNHIEYFDRAVTRSERFDAIIFISPPSLERKKRELLRILEGTYRIMGAAFAPEVTKEAIEAKMPSEECEKARRADKKERENIFSETLAQPNTLAKLALLRWDELSELALELAPIVRDTKLIDNKGLQQALWPLSDKRSRTVGDYCRFGSDQQYERFDASKNAVWRVLNVEGVATNGGPPSPVKKSGNGLIVQAPVGPINNISVPGFKVERFYTSTEVLEPGAVKLLKG